MSKFAVNVDGLCVMYGSYRLRSRGDFAFRVAYTAGILRVYYLREGLRQRRQH